MRASITFWATTLHFWLIECVLYQHLYLVSFDCLFSSLQLSSLISRVDRINLEGTCCSICCIIFLPALFQVSKNIYFIAETFWTWNIVYWEGGELRAQNSLSQPESSSEGTASSRGYLSKFEVSAVLWTFGRMGGVRLRVSSPSQSNPWKQQNVQSLYLSLPLSLWRRSEEIKVSCSPRVLARPGGRWEGAINVVHF